MDGDGGVDLVDVREAAALVHRTPETIRRWIWSGRIKADKIGNRLMIARSQLEQAGGDAQAVDDRLTMAEWVALARTAQRGGSAPTASGLVIADRAERSQLDAGR